MCILSYTHVHTHTREIHARELVLFPSQQNRFWTSSTKASNPPPKWTLHQPQMPPILPPGYCHFLINVRVQFIHKLNLTLPRFLNTFLTYFFPPLSSFSSHFLSFSPTCTISFPLFFSVHVQFTHKLHLALPCSLNTTTTSLFILLYAPLLSLFHTPLAFLFSFCLLLPILRRQG